MSRTGPEAAPHQEAHGHDGEVQGRSLSADRSERLQREQRQVRVHLDPAERHEVDHGGADDAQRSEFVQSSGVDVLPDRHARRQRVRAHDVEDVLRLVEVLGQPVAVQLALHGADHHPRTEGQPESSRQADPDRPAPRDEPGDQGEGDVDLGQPQLGGAQIRDGTVHAAPRSGWGRSWPPPPAFRAGRAGPDAPCPRVPNGRTT